jgi:DNA-directed RNA polymerase III subunit RPC1
MLDGKTHLDISPPAVIKPVALWTGKQVFNVLMHPNKESPVLVIRNSEVMCGRMDKNIIGAGRKEIRILRHTPRL